MDATPPRTVAAKFAAGRAFRHWQLPDGATSIDAAALRRLILTGLRLLTPATVGTKTLELTDAVSGVVLGEHDVVPAGAQLLLRVRNLEQPEEEAAVVPDNMVGPEVIYQ